MVMHARKPQRISDGYFDKHQAHPYQNTKYNSSKGGYSTSTTSSESRYEGPGFRERESPNGNSYSPAGALGMGMGTDRDSPRNYSAKPLYKKERENRDYKLSSSRDKYSDCARSPKDKRSRESRDSKHRTNHDRSVGGEEKRGDERGSAVERTARFGDWSEHMSSSGKKYYYNCKTEVSQWEKPREWVIRTDSRQRQSSDYSSRSSHDKHSNSRSNSSSGVRDGKSSSRQSDKREYWGASGGGGGGGGGAREDLSLRDSEFRGQRDKDKEQRDSRSNSGSSTRDGKSTRGGGPPDKREYWTSGGGASGGGGVNRDDLVGPREREKDKDRDRERERDRDANRDEPAAERQMQDMDISPGDSTPTSESLASNAHDPLPQGPVLLATALPRLTSHPPSTSQTPSNKDQSDITPQKALQTIQTAIMLSRQQSGNSERSSSGNDVMAPLKVDTTGNTTIEGPPTPTHSETQDCIDARKMTSPSGASSSVQSVSSLQSLNTLSTLGNLGNGVGLQALSRVQPPLTPSLTPSLANHYREDLTQHVRAFPADILEKQAQKLSEEAHTMGSLQCTRVSAELKTARSIVRLTEIQATLQEQRILFLRQQIKTLEQLKSQNSFMSDDS